MKCIVNIFNFYSNFTFSVPASMATKINISNLTSTSITIQYQLSSMETMYGQFKGFHLRLVPLINNEMKTLEKDTTETWFLFEGLVPFTLYGLQIAVRNHVGFGNFTEQLDIRTSQSGECCPLSTQLAHNAVSTFI